MGLERYSIEVGDGYVEIHGSLTFQEVHDFLHFFDKMGFNEVGIGDQNSTLMLYKNEKEEIEECEPESDLYENLYQQQIETCQGLRRRIHDLENLIDQLLQDVKKDVVAKTDQV